MAKGMIQAGMRRTGFWPDGWRERESRDGDWFIKIGNEEDSEAHAKGMQWPLPKDAVANGRVAEWPLLQSPDSQNSPVGGGRGRAADRLRRGKASEINLCHHRIGTNTGWDIRDHNRRKPRGKLGGGRIRQFLQIVTARVGLLTSPAAIRAAFGLARLGFQLQLQETDADRRS